MATRNGTPGNDNLVGTSGNDVLNGFAGNDTLNGGAGIDKLVGGKGNDTYIVNTTTDTIVELSGGGIDTVKSSVSYKLGDFLNNLTLTGSNAINGTGNDVDNIITGNNASNILEGKGGIDTLVGGKGNDTYIVDSTTDNIVELSGGGIDTVKSSVSYNTLSDFINNLTLTGTSAISGSGNILDNTITGNSASNFLFADEGDDVVFAGAGNDDVDGWIGDDSLYGEAGNDELLGYNGDDYLDGGSGNDLLFGEADDDTLIGSSGTDNHFGDSGFDTADYSGLSEAITLLPQGVISKGSLGTDSISGIEKIIGASSQFNAIDASSGTGGASLTVDLAADSLVVNNIPGLGTIPFTIENFVNVTGTLNDDTIIGNSDNNVLTGEVGNDTLTGNAGADTFVFFSPFEGIDTITDFEFGEGDKIQVSALGFGIGAGEFDQFSFAENSTEGALFFQGTQFASLQLGSFFIPELDINIV